MLFVKDQEEFGNFLLLFILDNFLKDDLIIKDFNEEWKDFIKRIKSVAKPSLSKAFTKIPIKDKQEYNKIRDAFSNKNYSGSHLIRFEENKELLGTKKNIILKTLDKTTDIATRVLMNLSEEEIEEIYKDTDLLKDLIVETLNENIKKDF